MDANWHRERRIKHGFTRLERAVAKFDQHFTLLRDILMADLQALRDEIEAVKQAVIDDEANDAALVVAMQAEIDRLEALVAAGTPVDTQEFLDKLKEIRDALQPPA